MDVGRSRSHEPSAEWDISDLTNGACLEPSKSRLRARGVCARGLAKQYRFETLVTLVLLSGHWLNELEIAAA